MNNKYFLVLPLLILCNHAYAERRVLPPVVENSTSTGGGSGSAFATRTPSNNAMYELLGRLEQLQAEVQQLRGLVEEQTQTINNLKTRQTNIYSDLDQRLQILSNTGQEAGEGFSPGTMTSDVVPNTVSQVPQVSEATQTAPDATQIASQASQVTQATSESEVSQASDKLSMAESSDKIAPTTTPAVSEKGLYKAAYESLRNGHNSQAISAFKGLIKDFPAGKYADNSQYWLGEAYKVNQDVDAARNAFSKVVEVYPNSPKVPDALLKLGYIELDQNNIAKARDYLTQVTVNYPGTTAAHLAAKKIMKLDQQ